MNKEEKVNLLTAWLAEVVAEKKVHDEPCAVTFLSANEVQMSETVNGSMPTNKVYPGNPLKSLLRTIVKCYYADEEKHWLEMVATEYAELPDEPDELEKVYSPALCPGHIYHALRELKALVADN